MKKVSKQILAFIMAFALMVVSAPMAYAAGNVKTIVLNNTDQITYCDSEYGIPFSNDYNDLLYKESGYKVEVDDGAHTIKITKIDGLAFSEPSGFTFSIITDGKVVDMNCEPTLKSAQCIAKPNEELTGTDDEIHTGMSYTLKLFLVTSETLQVRPTLKTAPHNITLPEGDQYEVTGNPTVEDGQDYSFTLKVYSDYKLYTPIVRANGTTISCVKNNDNEDGSVTYNCTISSVKEDKKVTVSLNAPVNVNLPAGTGYTASSETGSTVVPYGSDFTFNVTVAEGYGEPTVTANGSKLTKEGTSAGNKYVYKIPSVTLAQNVSISVSKMSYNVKIEKIGDGFETTAVGQTLDYGSNYSFSVSAIEGYDAPTVTAYETDKDEQSNSVELQKAGNTYTLNNIQKNVTIKITSASELTNSVILNGGDGYQITPAEGYNSDSVRYNTEFKFRVKLKDGYTNSTPVVTANNIILPGVPQGDESTEYTIENVVSQQVVTVTGVTKNTYKVDLIPGDGYTLTAVSSTTVPHGSTFEFSLSLDPAYANSKPKMKVQSTGQTQPVHNERTNTYTITVTEDIDISVTGIEKSKFTIDYSENGKGYKITSKSTEEQVPYNGSFNFKVEVDTGYKLVAVNRIEEGGAKYTLTSAGNNSYAINNITSNQTIEIVVETIKYTVRYIDPKNSTEVVVYDVGDEAVNGDGEITLKVPELDHYTFLGWYDETTNNKRTTLYLGEDNQSINLRAEWELNWTDLLSVEIADSTWTPQQGNDRYDLKVLATWEAEALDELGAEITSVGMFYSNKNTISDSESALTDLLSKKNNSDAGYHSEQASGRSDLYIYYHNVNFTSDLEAGRITQIFQALKADSLRSVRAYVQVKIDGETYTYYSDVWSGSYNQSHKD